MFGFTEKELTMLQRLRTPRLIQDYLETLPINFEPNGDTCRSPRRVLAEGTAHCIEGAMLAAVALRIHGARPLILDLEATPNDLDHVVALYARNGYWGAISKTNHAVLRFRDPVYRTIRELALSYFHEYTDLCGKKTLRAYTRPINLARFDTRGWMTADGDVWYIAEHLVHAPHTRILNRSQCAQLRRADPLEITAGELTAWKNTTAP